MKKVLRHLLLGIVLGLSVFVLSYLAMLIPGMGYGVFWFVYASILAAQVWFYQLTAIHARRWSIIGFILNFILWTTELVQLEHVLEGSSAHRILYELDAYYFLRYILGGVLWATNKLVLDLIIDRLTGQRRLHAGAVEA